MKNPAFEFLEKHSPYVLISYSSSSFQSRRHPRTAFSPTDWDPKVSVFLFRILIADTRVRLRIHSMLVRILAGTDTAMS